jgi:hypothetical protein
MLRRRVGGQEVGRLPPTSSASANKIVVELVSPTRNWSFLRSPRRQGQRCRIRPKSHGLPIAQLGATAPWPCLIGLSPRGEQLRGRCQWASYLLQMPLTQLHSAASPLFCVAVVIACRRNRSYTARPIGKGCRPRSSVPVRAGLP